MPPKKPSRQPSVESTALPWSDQASDSDLDSSFDPVQAATELNRVIEGLKKRRFAARQAIEKKYHARVAEIVERAEKRLAEREKKASRIRQEQLSRLVAAATERDAKQRAVADKVGRFYDGCVTLADLLQNVYSGLADEARRAALPAGQEKQP